VAYASHALPGWLALPIGSGDILVGIAAIPLATRLRRGSGGRGTAVHLWNISGMALAAFTAVASLAAMRTAGYFLSLYPLVLFPTFLAPASFVLHLLVMARLRPPSPPAPAS
jgi:hypothetical protein